MLFDQSYQSIFFLLNLGFEFQEISCQEIFDFLQSVRVEVKVVDLKIFVLKTIDLVSFRLETMGYRLSVST